MGMYSSMCIHKHIHTQAIGMREEEFWDFAQDLIYGMDSSVWVCTHLYAYINTYIHKR
jgi:hypothetical protein